MTRFANEIVVEAVTATFSVLEWSAWPLLLLSVLHFLFDLDIHASYYQCWLLILKDHCFKPVESASEKPGCQCDGCSQVLKHKQMKRGVV